MMEKGIPRHGYEIKDFSGMKIGEVTSGTQSPSLNKAIGMGYVRDTFRTRTQRFILRSGINFYLPGLSNFRFCLN